jgi:hypothetical protein
MNRIFYEYLSENISGFQDEFFLHPVHPLILDILILIVGCVSEA